MKKKIKMPIADIYHNPRCSKSRSSLALLKEKGIEVNEVRYLDTPPNSDKLAELCRLMKVSPIDIMRTGETLFKELGLDKNDHLSDQEWIQIMVQNPKLIERPIVQLGNNVVIGRPPEKILDILG